MQYCYKCGAEIKQINNYRTCNLCGAHIYGQPDGNLTDSDFRQHNYGLWGGWIKLIGSSMETGKERSKAKTNAQIYNEYYESDYYKFTRESFENVLSDRGMIGEYAIEGWIKGKQKGQEVEAIKYPFSVMYNLMIPEKEDLFQEVDMVILTDYYVFVVEVKNRNGNLQLNHWSDNECQIGGETAHSPIIQNDRHITALKQYLTDAFSNNDEIYINPNSFINIVAISPFMEVSYSYEYDEFDEFVLDTSDVCVCSYVNVAKVINKYLDNHKFNKIDYHSYYNALIKCCFSSAEDRSLRMRYREDAYDEHLKHSWNYYIAEKTTNIGNEGQRLIRKNGINTEEYYYYIWHIPLRNDKYRIIKQLSKSKDMMDAKSFFDSHMSSRHPMYVNKYRKAAEQGDADAQYQLGEMYYLGEEVEKDNEEALEWYQKAAEQGNLDAQNKLGDIYYLEKENVGKAFEWYQKAAERGDSYAQYRLGEMHYRGEGVRQDYEKALELYQKSAEQGNPDAKYYLGEMYHDGKGVEKDYIKAFEWYQKAAALGHEKAENILASNQIEKMPQSMEDVEQDSEKSFEWYQKAAEQGDSYAQYKLGKMYYHGSGVNQDYEKAFEMFNKSALDDNRDSIKYISKMYYYGEGVEQNYEKAFELFQEQADRNDVDAKYYLGEMYHDGKGVEQDYDKAYEFFNEAAKEWDTNAQYQLGNMYFYGEGVQFDYAKARDYWQKAAIRGNMEAKKVLDSINRIRY